MRVVAVVLGATVVLGVVSSVLRTLVVPRMLRSKLAALAFAGTAAPFRWVARRSTSYLTRDRVLAWAAPLSILTTLVAWLLGFLLGYALLLYGLSGLSLPTSLREAGSSLLTLGFASSARAQLTVVDFVAAATGPIVIGLLIGYLSTVYAAYNRRETEVTMLESRAGEPNWGPEILARHASVESLANLEDLYYAWERWSADISESHTNYPVLVHVRSSRPLRHWLVGLVSVMDAAALQLALCPAMPQGRPRIALRMGFVALRDIAQVEHIRFDPDPSPDDPITLGYQDFLEGVRRATAAGFPVERSPEEAWPHFRGWRVNYEQIAYALAHRLDAPPARWSGPRRGDLVELAPRTPVDRRPGEGRAAGGTAASGH